MDASVSPGSMASSLSISVLALAVSWAYARLAMTWWPCVPQAWAGEVRRARMKGKSVRIVVGVVSVTLESRTSAPPNSAPGARVYRMISRNPHR
jgi:hypothetical protein